MQLFPNVDFVIIQVWGGQQARRLLPLERWFITDGSQEEGAHHVWGGGTRGSTGWSGDRRTEGKMWVRAFIVVSAERNGPDCLV